MYVIKTTAISRQDTNPQSSFPLAETMTPVPRRQRTRAIGNLFLKEVIKFT
jgi:hypothetical protein